MLDLQPAEQERYQCIRETAQFNRMAEGRELKLAEFKREVNELCEQHGIEPRYVLSHADKMLMDRERERRQARQRAESWVEVEAGEGVPC